MPGVNPWFCLGSLDKESPKAEILRRLQRARGLRIGTALSLAARSDADVDLKKGKMLLLGQPSSLPLSLLAFFGCPSVKLLTLRSTPQAGRAATERAHARLWWVRGGIIGFVSN